MKQPIAALPPMYDTGGSRFLMEEGEGPCGNDPSELVS